MREEQMLKDLHERVVRDTRTPDYCEECKAGRHRSECRRGLGCLKVVAKPPRDYVCKCRK